MNETERFPYQNPDLPLESRVNDLVSRFTIDEKINLMCQYQDAVPRLGVKPYKHGTEAAHGIAWLGEATYFPQPAGLACTWDSDLLKQVGQAIGTEARGFFRRDPALNGLTLWAPTVDMERDPRWGRNEEAYGEDPHLAGKLTAALTQGIQGDHPFYLRAIASLKHFIGNNNEIDRGDCSVSIDPRNMREYYLKAFQIPFVEGGAQSMMTAYNSVNGVPANLNPQVKEIVKQEWGMNGFVVSDAGDVLGTVNEHRYFDNFKDAVVHSIKSGIDSITDDHAVSKQAIRDGLADGSITENDLDIALRNTFRVRFRLGEFDPDERNPYAGIEETVIGADAHREISRQAALKNVVLLKNDQATLPLKGPSLGKVAVLGPLADIVYRDWYSGNLPYSVTPLQAIRDKLGSDRVRHANGNDRLKLRSVDTGNFVTLTHDGRLTVAASSNTLSSASPEILERTDWGWGANSFIPLSCPSNYLTTADDAFVTASATEIFGWFTKEVFHWEQVGEGRAALTTWNNGPIVVNEDGSLTVGEGKATKDVHGNWIGPDVEISSPTSSVFETVLVADGIQEAIAAARESDVAIVFVGNHPLINGKETIDRPDLTLPDAQDRLIREVYAANPNTIVVIVGSYPFAVNWADENVPAILYSSHAGPELGTALADVLFGDYAPAGRVNMTWYRSTDDLPDFMDYDIIRGERTYQYFKGDVLYPFGHGLTYSTFEYSGAKLSSSHIADDETIRLQFNVRNAGAIASDEVVQLYGRALESRVKRPLKQLLGFRRLHLAAGESATVVFEIPARDLCIWDVTRNSWCLEAGEWSLSLGRSSSDAALTLSLLVQGETIPPRDLRLRTDAVLYDDYSGFVIDENKEGGSCVYSKEEPSWIRFSDAEFGEDASIFFEIRVSSVSEGQIKVYSDEDTLITTLFVSPTGSSQSWHTLTSAVNSLTGRTDITLSATTGIRISHFRFV